MGLAELCLSTLTFTHSLEKQLSAPARNIRHFTVFTMQLRSLGQGTLGVLISAEWSKALAEDLSDIHNFMPTYQNLFY